MSESTKINKSHINSKRERGTMQSYIAGFILSLVFTINAYYLIVSKTLTGRPLLITIFTLAVLQMATQIFFFLHLGRGPKPLYNVIFFIGTVGLILVVVLGSIFINNNLRYNMSPSQVTNKLTQNEAISQVGGLKTGACQEIKVNHKVTILRGIITPAVTEAHLCDTLSFINADSIIHIISFGPFPQHNVYGGETDLNVHQGYAKIITLNRTGTYQFHNEINTGSITSFTVTP
jgi:cytochrome o ubiquinol oxidase operon protein cyoD